MENTLSPSRASFLKGLKLWSSGSLFMTFCSTRLGQQSPRKSRPPNFVRNFGRPPKSDGFLGFAIYFLKASNSFFKRWFSKDFLHVLTHSCHCRPRGRMRRCRGSYAPSKTSILARPGGWVGWDGGGLVGKLFFICWFCMVLFFPEFFYRWFGFWGDFGVIFGLIYYLEPFRGF